MTYTNFIVIAGIALFLLLRMLPAKGVKNISTAELKQVLKEKNKQFVDVRTPAEFKSNHINGFINMPLHQLSNKANQLSKEKEVVVICQSGMRSTKASKQLKKMGFTNVMNVRGGMSAWN
ncbi:rhodanese-like domain-containing protein [Neobacillus sp. PS3-34]|uniref:rhodanese-like domain-containing protein n=1 Tax=Neobacillus sp. PS3-34 TaxID=3070678 RepID=UPI0027E1BEE9|nr:rhodanese-like domain-containing protein [Neobacillus sp. PS3-34]WML47143.1 rhodanese-like domain-containing protein [Neobacillus sp. PS3-34]